MNENLPWLILFLPLLSAVVITLFTQKHHALSSAISVSAIVLSFLLSIIVFTSVGDVGPKLNFNWLTVGTLHVDFGLQLDHLSLLMLLIVTGVGSAIHIYSVGYMHGDPSFSRFFACLSFFTFSMLGIVLSKNFFQMFIFWELVGVSSYMLIGFWYEKPSAADAAKKAFLTNRIGDFGFLVGIIMLWVQTKNLGFDSLPVPAVLGSATAIGLLIFCGAVGKSAQFPLHVWLPDAMEGPTPVSALIHAATMVAAGVYMLSRVFVIFNADALMVIAWIGAITALLAALIAVQQNDIKRILAYSTLSQLGYMVMAVGAGGPAPAMFHLATHAFFKALLFLAAGSVIHGLTNEQDIWKMGALKKKMPVTYWTFLIGTLALCGVIGFSGFYSKDAILAQDYYRTHNIGLFSIGVFVAILTTFYMFRLFFVVFLGKEKSHHAEHAHESPKVMTLPLVVLAVFSVIGGFMGIEQYVIKQIAPGEELAPIFAPFAPILHAPVASICGLLAVGVGFILAYTLYAKASTDPLPAKFPVMSALMRNKFYFDELYAKLIALTQDALAKFIDAFDRWVVAGFMVRGTQGVTEICGRALRLVQTGNLQTYTFLFATGVAVVLYLVLFR